MTLLRFRQQISRLFNMGAATNGQIPVYSSSTKRFEPSTVVANIPALWVTTGMIANLGVTTGKIAANAVDTSKLAEDTVQTVTLVLAPIDITQLFTAPVLPIPAPWAGKAITDVIITAVNDFNASPYAGANNMVFTIGWQQVASFPAAFLNTAANRLDASPIMWFTNITASNLPLQCQVLVADPTIVSGILADGGTITLKVKYRVVAVPF